jgi:hypothetical protein
VSLSSFDDYPVHQASEFIAHPATSDRNFYDRYYFNLHPRSDGYSAIFGFGQYPNLGVVDAFVDVRMGPRQYIVRASAPLVDRGQLSVGPFTVEVLEPLKRLRFTVAETEHPVAMDVAWEGSVPAIAEPRQYLRAEGRVVFDTQRLVQTGTWSGRLRVADTELAVTPDRCWGCRDRSWGVRPVGEPEADGIRKGKPVLAGMWNYFPMQFDDHSIIVMCHEQDDGVRPLTHAERVWGDPDRPHDDLGPMVHEHRFEPGTRILAGSVLRFPETGVEITAEPLLANFLSVGTGYGLDRDWRHGMYQGPDPVVQGLVLEVPDIQGVAQYAVVDQVARYSYDGRVGYGLYEHMFVGPFRRYGMTDRVMGAPGG